MGDIEKNLPRQIESESDEELAEINKKPIEASQMIYRSKSRAGKATKETINKNTELPKKGNHFFYIIC